ncbi:MAG: NTP transferase domain-containing protein [Chloroflexi bacterium]|nr:NTP transferase domain-containing protein [Chloroflexota bacterium]
MDKTVAMILAGGAGERLSILTAERAKPGLPFGGRYRIIDFTLSNCVNSGINTVAVLTQYDPRSLAQHLGTGRPWDLDRVGGGLFILQPYMTREGGSWYQGTADALRQNLYFIEEQGAERALVLAGDHIYTMRYEEMIAFHRVKKADVTVGLVQVLPSEAHRFGMASLDEEGRITEFHEKPAQPPVGDWASMGIYIFDKDFLISCLRANRATREARDLGRDVLPALLGQSRIYGYPFRGYWRDVGTVQSYFDANMELIVDLPEFNLYDPATRVRTPFHAHPPVKVGPRAHISRSLVSSGSIINGYVSNSILFCTVYVEHGAAVEDAIIFEDTRIERGSSINRSILDKQVYVGEGSCVGFGDGGTPNKEEPSYLNTGITLVGKGARIPAGARIGRNCKVNPWVTESDFPSLFIPNGETVAKK